MFKKNSFGREIHTLLSNISCLTCDELVTCPRCTRPLALSQLGLAPAHIFNTWINVMADIETKHHYRKVTYHQWNRLIISSLIEVCLFVVESSCCSTLQKYSVYQQTWWGYKVENVHLWWLLLSSHLQLRPALGRRLLVHTSSRWGMLEVCSPCAEEMLESGTKLEVFSGRTCSSNGGPSSRVFRCFSVRRLDVNHLFVLSCNIHCKAGGV